jgi:beta-galactosidase
LFSGKLLAIVAGTMETGEIKVTAESPGLSPATLVLKSVAANIRKGISTTYMRNGKSEPNREIPIRKIMLTGEYGNNPGEIFVKANVCPANATYDELEWRVTDKSGIDSIIAGLSADGNTAKVMAVGDGDIYVRCATKNGGDKINLYSQLDFSITGLGKAYMNPYGFISGALYNRSNAELANGNDRGVATLRDGVSHIGFEGVDFGPVGADEITMPIFSLDKSPFQIEIWEGMPNDDGGKKIGCLHLHKRFQVEHVH